MSGNRNVNARKGVDIMKIETVMKTGFCVGVVLILVAFGLRAVADSGPCAEGYTAEAMPDGSVECTSTYVIPAEEVEILPKPRVCWRLGEGHAKYAEGYRWNYQVIGDDVRDPAYPIHRRYQADLCPPWTKASPAGNNGNGTLLSNDEAAGGRRGVDTTTAPAPSVPGPR